MRAPRKCPLCGLPPGQTRFNKGQELSPWLRFAMHVFWSHNKPYGLEYCPCGYIPRSGKHWKDNLTDHLRQLQTVAELREHLVLGAISSVGMET